MACKLYVRCGQLDTYLGHFKDQEKAAAHFQLVKSKLESEMGSGIKPIYVQEGKRK